MKIDEKNKQGTQADYTPDVGFRSNTFVLGTYQDFVKQEAQYFLQHFSVPHDFESDWEKPSARELMAQGRRPNSNPSNISYLIASTLNNKTNPSLVMNNSIPFAEGAQYYFYRDQYTETNRDIEMLERFRDVAIQTMNKLDFAGMNGVQDFMPKNHVEFHHMDGRIHRDMNNEIGRLTNDIAFKYLIEQAPSNAPHTAEALEPFVNREIVIPYEQGIAQQRSLTTKVLGLMDIKEDVLKDYSKPEFLARFGRAIDLDAFNADANLNHIYHEAQSQNIAIPDSFVELQAGLNHLGRSGIEFTGVNAIQFPTNHRELSSILHREGVDINDSELRASAQSFKETIGKDALSRSPFTPIEKKVESPSDFAEALKAAQLHHSNDPSPSM